MERERVSITFDDGITPRSQCLTFVASGYNLTSNGENFRRRKKNNNNMIKIKDRKNCANNFI